MGGFNALSTATPENFWNILPNDGAGAVELTQRVLCASDTKAARQCLVIWSGMYAIAGFFEDDDRVDCNCDDLTVCNDSGRCAADGRDFCLGLELRRCRCSG